jgi:hypothetical protein
MFTTNSFLHTKVVLLILTVMLCGCESATHWSKRPDFTKIHIGMSQTEVIQAFGKPEDMSAQGKVVYLTYTWTPWYDHNGADGNKEYYFVRLIDNKVESFGKRGDFDSTKPPEQTINVNVNQK